MTDINTDPEVVAALADDGELSDELAARIVDRISRPANPQMPLGARTPWRPVARLVTDQPEHDSQYGAECQAAWRSYLDVVTTWQDARDLVDAIPADQAEELAEAKRVMLDQERDGKPLKAPKPKDWPTETATREVKRDIAFERGQAAYAAYSKLVVANAARWAAEQVPALASAHAAAVAALTALSAVEKWLQVRDSAIELAELQNPGLSDYNVMTNDDRAVLSAGRGAVFALRALLASEHPVITGRFITESPADPIQPPMHVRHYMAASERGAELLAAIEVAEDGKVSKLVRDVWSLAHLGAGVSWRRSRR